MLFGWLDSKQIKYPTHPHNCSNYQESFSYKAATSHSCIWVLYKTHCILQATWSPRYKKMSTQIVNRAQKVTRAKGLRYQKPSLVEIQTISRPSQPTTAPVFAPPPALWSFLMIYIWPQKDTWQRILRMHNPTLEEAEIIRVVNQKVWIVLDCFINGEHG